MDKVDVAGRLTWPDPACCPPLPHTHAAHTRTESKPRHLCKCHALLRGRRLHCFLVLLRRRWLAG